MGEGSGGARPPQLRELLTRPRPAVDTKLLSPGDLTIEGPDVQKETKGAQKFSHTMSADLRPPKATDGGQLTVRSSYEKIGGRIGKKPRQMSFQPQTFP